MLFSIFFSIILCSYWFKRDAHYPISETQIKHTFIKKIHNWLDIFRVYHKQQHDTSNTYIRYYEQALCDLHSLLRCLKQNLCLKASLQNNLNLFLTKTYFLAKNLAWNLCHFCLRRYIQRQDLLPVMSPSSGTWVIHKAQCVASWMSWPFT